MQPPPTTNIKTLVELYDGFLIDAFGVLVNGTETLPGAREFISLLEKKKKNYLIVTNNASSVRSRISESFTKHGFDISEEKILSSGSLIKPWIEENFSQAPKCLFMGHPNAEKLLEEVNCSTTNLKKIDDSCEEDFDLVIVCSQEDEKFRTRLESLMNYMIKAKEKGKFPKLLLPNPDCIYPKNSRNFGIVSGMTTLILEKALELRFGEHPHKFFELGKPSSYIFEKAKEKISGKRLIMIGDQIETDVKGAHQSGIDSALLLGGVVKGGGMIKESSYKPTFVLESLL